MEIRPHAGPQAAFLASRADLAIFGGSAGGGKSRALLMEPLRHIKTNPQFFAVCFRRTTTQVRNPGGLWDQSMNFYPHTGGIPRASLEWLWKGGGKLKFAHLEYEATKLDWSGSEVALIMFDELVTFTASQFWYLLSRNRSMSGVRGYVRATCNPDADSWVATLIAWWINQDTGFPIPERSGVLRWFVRVEDHLEWGDSRAALKARFPWSRPKSLTFIGAKLSDNPTLEKADPGYRANLMNMQLVERERLLLGNWKIRPAAGLYFRKEWVTTIDAVPAGMIVKRGWDLAATAQSGGNDPDWTCGVKLGRTLQGQYVVLDVRWMRGTPADVERLLFNTATADDKKCQISLPIDPGSGGKSWTMSLVRMLAGFPVHTSAETGSKIARFSPFSAQCEAGNVSVLRGDWNARYLSEIEAFPEAKHDDSADATSRAFQAITAGHVVIGAGYVGFGSREQDGWSQTN